MHIAHLARAENELLASRLEDKLRFVFREHVRGAVVFLRFTTSPERRMITARSYTWETTRRRNSGVAAFTGGRQSQPARCSRLHEIPVVAPIGPMSMGGHSVLASLADRGARPGHCKPFLWSKLN